MLDSYQKLIGKVVANKYYVEKLIGKGSFAWVFIAKDREGKSFAIKIIHKNVKETITRFYREIKVLQLLPPDPNIVKYIEDGFLPDGTPYLVLEYIEGETLKETLKSKKILSPILACEFMIQLCKAFSGIHKLGVVHRDIKPDNIIITKDNDIKLIDFGLIKDAQGVLKLFEEEDILEGKLFSENIDKGFLAGTPEYMAPEQFRDSTLSDEQLTQTEPATDVYSLGIIFYQLLSGNKPFPMRNITPNEYPKELLRYLTYRIALQDSDLPVLEDIDPSLWSLIRRALRVDPKLRQRDAIVFMNDIDKYLTLGEEVEPIDESKTQFISVDEIMKRHFQRVTSSVGFKDQSTVVDKELFNDIPGYFDLLFSKMDKSKKQKNVKDEFDSEDSFIDESFSDSDAKTIVSPTVDEEDFDDFKEITTNPVREIFIDDYKTISSSYSQEKSDFLSDVTTNKTEQEEIDYKEETQKRLETDNKDELQSKDEIINKDELSLNEITNKDKTKNKFEIETKFEQEDAEDDEWTEKTFKK